MRIILDRYELTAPIASGGMGTLWEGTDQRRSPLTGKRWPQPPGEASRARTGGPGERRLAPGPARLGQLAACSSGVVGCHWSAGRVAGVQCDVGAECVVVGLVDQVGFACPLVAQAG